MSKPLIACLAVMLNAGSIPAADAPQGTTAMSPDELQQSHRHFSTDCFNNCWTLFDKADRTPEDVENMLLLAQASLWHWKQRSDCQPSNLAIGYWQVSRAHALAGQYEPARQFGEKCLQVCETHKLSPFDIGYAYEALARAEVLHQDLPAAKAHLAKARGELEKVAEQEERKLLEADLSALDAAVTKE